MNNRIGTIVLVVICLGLGIGLISFKHHADTQLAKDTETIGTLSNNLTSTSAKLTEQERVATMLQKDLDTQKKSFEELTNKYTQATADLAKTEASLKASQEAEAKLEAGGSREAIEAALTSLEKARLRKKVAERAQKSRVH